MTGDPLERGWLVVQGHPMYHRECRIAGADAPAMVHVHGFGISGTYLEPTAAALAVAVSHVRARSSGHGRSMRHDRPLDLPGLANALISYCDAVGVDKATFVGNSLGCPIICEVAASFPERIERAVLVSPAGGQTNQPLGRAIGRWCSTPTRTDRHGPDRRAGLSAFRGVAGVEPVQVDDRVPNP